MKNILEIYLLRGIKNQFQEEGNETYGKQTETTTGAGTTSHVRSTQYKQPSTSNRAVTRIVTRSRAKSLLEIEDLFLDRVEGNRETRAAIPTVDVQQMIVLGQDRLLEEKSNSRWNHLSSVYKQYTVWKENLGNDVPSEDWCIICFLESKMGLINPQTQRGTISIQTAHTYAKSLIQIIFRSGVNCKSRQQQPICDPFSVKGLKYRSIRRPRLHANKYWRRANGCFRTKPRA